MKRTRELLDRLGIDVPVVLAPMAGNSTPELVAAVSKAGGLGSYGCAMLSHEQLAEECTRIRALTNRSFNLNLFVPIRNPLRSTLQPRRRASSTLTPLRTS